MACLHVYPSTSAMAAAAAADAGRIISAAQAGGGICRVVFATGNSQLAFYTALQSTAGIDWARVVGFLLDEYAGLPDTHPASFRKYLRERLVEVVKPREFHYMRGDAPDVAAECARYAALLAEQPLDLVCLGIGENGHLAFNGAWSRCGAQAGGLTPSLCSRLSAY